MKYTECEAERRISRGSRKRAGYIKTLVDECEKRRKRESEIVEGNRRGEGAEGRNAMKVLLPRLCSSVRAISVYLNRGWSPI